MKWRSTCANLMVPYLMYRQAQWSKFPLENQARTLKKLIGQARQTAFGKDHHFDRIKNYSDFKKYVPLRDYEDLKPYIERVRKGEANVLWKGKPLYFAKTSGTTSGVKYIPITKASMPNHIQATQYALANYIYHTGKSAFLDHKWIFLQGSPYLERQNGIHIGRLSGIVNHHVPQILRSNQMPTYKTNCIADWETKLDQIIIETLQADLAVISGIPPWVQMYFDKIITREAKSISEVFPKFSLFIYGGVNFEPYRTKLFDSIGKKVDSIELFPASEGFFAYQDDPTEKSMLLFLDGRLFYEFVDLDTYFDNPVRISLADVELHKNYALIITSNAGLWSYKIGDTVKFVSKNPYRLLVTGRTKHFTSAFGEHVIASEVEQALRHALDQYPETQITEFTVAPQVRPKTGKPHHEWFIAFAQKPADLEAFGKAIDAKLCSLNTYYDDLIKGNILRSLIIKPLEATAFQTYMTKIGRLGGQNKVPRLSNNRKIVANLQSLES